ncbi:hypothetical protein EDC04DRAFT_2598822 [Pisolithus marmoratus]|nr:hypothetical protein EDC04DRAFT_2598822 [Pisolithus marmoratus]
MEEVVIEASENFLPEGDSELAVQHLLEEEMHDDQGQDGCVEPEVDEAKEAHDEAAVHSVSARAVHEMGVIGIKMTAADEKAALSVMPKARLAHRVNDSAHLQEEFERIVISLSSSGTSNKVWLDQHVPTHWNSDYTCLKSHMCFKKAVMILTCQRRIRIGELFEELTLRFSSANVPLVHEVIPMLECLEHMMTRVRDAPCELPVIRIAAKAALLMIGKYYALTDDSEVYRIAIVMCPDRKAEWFDKNPDWHPEDRLTVRQVVRERWEKSYVVTSPGHLATQDVVTTHNSSPLKRKRSKWAIDDSDNEGDDLSSNPDSIDAYLDSPTITKSELKAAGASSVDAERAFSGGRLQVNHLQHRISSQSFKAQVAVGSWYGSPVLPDTKSIAGIINKKTRIYVASKYYLNMLVNTYICGYLGLYILVLFAASLFQLRLSTKWQYQIGFNIRVTPAIGFHYLQWIKQTLRGFG